MRTQNVFIIIFGAKHRASRYVTQNDTLMSTRIKFQSFESDETLVYMSLKNFRFLLMNIEFNLQKCLVITFFRITEIKYQS